MPAPVTPHFRFPFRFAHDHVAVVEQDTFDEVAQCVQVVLTTPLGSRQEVPTFGVDDPLFSPFSASHQQRLLAAVKKWEPRAEASLELTVDNIDDFVHHIRVEVTDRPDDNHSAFPYVPDEEALDGDESFGDGAFGTGAWSY